MKIKTTIIATLVSVLSFAGGTETFHLTGSKTLSLNGLYFAGADGIIKSLNNPAGLMNYYPTGAEFSVLNRLAQNRFESSGKGLFKSFRNDEILYGGGVFWGLSENFKLAAAYQPDINYNIEWPFARNFSADTISSLLVFDYYNRIKSDAISLSAAYRTGKFSFGISPVLYRVTFNSAFPLVNPGWPDNKNAAYQVENSLEGWAFGFVAGVIGDLNPDLKVGLSVKSAYKADIEGTGKSKFFSDILSAASESEIKTSIESPWILGLGTLYSLGGKWNINFDIRYSMWGSVPEMLKIEYSQPGWSEPMSIQDPLSGITGSSINSNFRNAIDLGLGIEFLSSETFSYRFSYRFSQSHNEDEGYSMFFPTVDQHWLSLGFGLHDEFIILDAAIAYGIGPVVNIGQNGKNTAGEYGYGVVIPVISLKYLIK